MKNWIFPLTLLLSFSAIATDEISIEASQAPLVVKGMKLTGFTGEHLKKMQKAFVLLEHVVNSEEFKQRVLKFKNRNGKVAFASNKGLTNEQIYEVFMEGRETLQPNTPNEMNFYLNLYYSRWSRVVGYTTPSTNTININSKYFYGYRPNEVAGNLAHEWTHKLGFDHTSASQWDSAPYAIGNIVEELAGKLK